MCEKIKV